MRKSSMDIEDGYNLMGEEEKNERIRKIADFNSSYKGLKKVRNGWNENSKHYERISILGKGSVGEVWSAANHDAEIVVAIKIINKKKI